MRARARVCVSACVCVYARPCLNCRSFCSMCIRFKQYAAHSTVLHVFMHRIYQVVLKFPHASLLIVIHQYFTIPNKDAEPSCKGNHLNNTNTCQFYDKSIHVSHLPVDLPGIESRTFDMKVRYPPKKIELRDI